MSRFSLARMGRYIPAGSTCVTAKTCAAVFYLSTNAKGQPSAIAYVGKQNKPLWHYSFASEERRAAKIAETIKNREASEKYKADRHAETVAARKAPLSLTSDYISAPQTAVLIRAQLKAKFPGVKFSVRSDHNSIRIYWTDGPTQRQVDRITNPFHGGGFDGMIDMAYSVRSWLLPDGSAAYGKSEGTEGSRGSAPAYSFEAPCIGARLVHFGATYIFTERDLSEMHKARAAKAWAELDSDTRCTLWNRMPRTHDTADEVRYALIFDATTGTHSDAYAA